MPHALRIFAGIAALALPLGLIGCGGGGSSGGGGGSSDAETLIKNNTCPTCHSPDGKSATDLSGGTKDLITEFGKHAQGSNLTPDMATGLGTWTDDQIKNAILHGKRNDGSQLCSVMYIFGTPCNASEQSCLGPLSDSDVTTIVGYLKGLPATSHKVDISSCKM
jgi:hypothetical protein